MKMTKSIRGKGRKITDWQRSARFRAIGVAGLVRARAKIQLMLKCSAKAKWSGEPCKQVALSNGKCHYHGGRTPRDEQWHRLQLPKKDTDSEWAKFTAKQINQAESAKRRDRLIERLSPSEKTKLSKWVRTHEPGSKAGRAARREIERQNLATREMFAKPAAAPSPEAQELRKAIDILDAYLNPLRGGVFD